MVIALQLARLITEKLKAGSFDGSQIPNLIKNNDFTNDMTRVELEERTFLSQLLNSF